jgi:hypothetical protein
LQPLTCNARKIRQTGLVGGGGGLSFEHLDLLIARELKAGVHPGDLLDLLEELEPEQKAELIQKLE